MEARRETQNTFVVYLALHISNVLLAQVTQRGDTGFRVYPVLKDYSGWTVKCFLTDHLLSSPSPTMSARELFNYTMYSVDNGPQFWREPTSEGGGKDVIAISFAGQVAFRNGHFKVPQTPADAFEIVVLPSKLIWQGNPKERLLDAHNSEEKNREAAHTTRYNLFQDDDTPIERVMSLEIRQTPDILPTVTVDGSRINLRYRFPSTGDQYVTLSKALINYALTLKATSSGIPLADLPEHPTFHKLRKLQFKRPGSLYLLEHGEPGHQDIRAVASYNGDKMADFMRFGTEDAMELRCIIQDSSISIYDCVILAEEMYGSHWLIMANP